MSATATRGARLADVGRRAKAMLPDRTRARLAWLRRWPEMFRLATDRRSLRTLLSISRPHIAPDHSRTCGVRMRPLGGAEVRLRPGTADAFTAASLVGAFHLPPVHQPAPRLIWDLGANIGLTMAHMARLFPAASIVGVEVDHDNAVLARRNLTTLGDRCALIEAAIWWQDGLVSYSSRLGKEAGVTLDPSGSATARAMSLNALLSEVGSPDYVKMDIEGAEREVLSRNTEWASAVRCLSVECHGVYGQDDCVRDLQRLGFRAHALPRSRSWRARTVIGLRE